MFRCITALLWIWSYTGMAEDFVSVCDRTESVAEFITQTVSGQKGTQLSCEDITSEDLLEINRVSIAFAGDTVLHSDDFSGLYGLEILNIRSNPYQFLPEGLFKDLVNLKTLVIIDTGLETYPDDFLEHTPLLENCHCFRNPLTTIDSTILERFAALQNLRVLDFDRSLNEDTKAFLESAFPSDSGVFLSFY